MLAHERALRGRNESFFIRRDQCIAKDIRLHPQAIPCCELQKFRLHKSERR